MVDGNRNRPTMVEVAALLGRVPGFEGPTPRWGAVLAYLGGSPLTDADVDLLVQSTHRTRERADTQKGTTT